MNRTMKVSGLAFCVALLVADAAWAQTAPPPRRMPRLPVSQESLAEVTDFSPSDRHLRELHGAIAVIDPEHLRIDKADVRLFGIVPPQLSASYGPQARAALDSIAGGQNATCLLRDRDRDGRLLATCLNGANSDMALELLKRGLAVAARGSLTSTELATPYLAAEQAAQNAKLGLWALSSAAPSVALAPKEETPKAPETPKADKQKQEMETTATQEKIAADLLTKQAQTQAHIDAEAWEPPTGQGFVERYQILLTGFLIFAMGLSFIGGWSRQKQQEKKEERRALAAALRGELMAARSVCQGRGKSILSPEEDQAAVWPRIRTTLYQAHVGRLGMLGAELARQISSVYGRLSDYAAFYAPDRKEGADLSKKTALETLVRHMDEILPKLALIEKTGCLGHNVPVQAVRAPHPYPQAEPPHPVASVEPPAEDPLPDSAPIPEPLPSVVSPEAAPDASSPKGLWGSVNTFIRTHTHSSKQSEPSPDVVSDYTAIIEADMARYAYAEEIETYDITPPKTLKRGP